MTDAVFSVHEKGRRHIRLKNRANGASLSVSQEDINKAAVTRIACPPQSHASLLTDLISCRVKVLGVHEDLNRRPAAKSAASTSREMGGERSRAIAQREPMRRDDKSTVMPTTARKGRGGGALSSGETSSTASGISGVTAVPQIRDQTNTAAPGANVQVRPRHETQTGETVIGAEISPKLEAQ